MTRTQSAVGEGPPSEPVDRVASEAALAGRRTVKTEPLPGSLVEPQIAPRDRDQLYARPDDPCEYGTSWRQLLAEYNKNPGNNPFRFYPAYQLYENKVYGSL
jgi:hypothetical protein